MRERERERERESFLNVQNKEEEDERKVLSERVLGCHDVVLLRFMLFFFVLTINRITPPYPHRPL